MIGLLKDFWRNARSEISRVEQQVDYSVPADLAIYRRYLAGETITLEELAGDWYHIIGRTTAGGIAVHRFRVFDLPLPDYQKYEIDWGYLVGARFGQQTWAIRRPLYADLLAQEGLSACDFWTFDKQSFLLVNYDDKGDWLGESEVVDNPEYMKLKKALELVSHHAVSLDAFLSSVGYVPTKHSAVIFP